MMTASSVKIYTKRSLAKRKDSTVIPSGYTDVEIMDSFVTEPTQKYCYQDSIISLDKLPRFTVIINRTETEGVDIDDLDQLQLELEALLSAVAVRNRVLEKEFNALNCATELAQDQSEGNSSSHSMVKQIDGQNKLVKRVKEVSCKSFEGVNDNSAPVKVSKLKKPNDIPSVEPRSKPEEKLPQLSQRRYEPPNKFWTSMNPFCTDISYQDLKFLEELIEKYENNQDILKIPLLGRPYSERWAEEELLNEQFESHSEGKTKAKRTVTSVESYMLLNKAKNLINGPIAMPLTERCISALLEENIEVPQNESTDSCKFLGERITYKSGLCKESGSSSLEKRILRALEYEDILDSSFHHSESGDEILQEIRNCQTEMEVINGFNVTNLKRVLKLAKAEVARQDLKRKLEMVDNEVFENYRILLAAKQKKLPLSKALEEQCWNSLKERDELKHQLDSLLNSE